LQLVLLVCLVGVASRASSEPIVDRESDEADLNRRRSEWIERIHRTAPGVDWRAIESANRLEAQFLRRSFLGPRDTSPWQEKGASNLTGRNWVSALAADQSTLYVGSANGGLFRRAIAGYGVHHLAYVPGAPERLLIASHDGRMFFSADGGTSWDLPSGLPESIGATWRVVQEANQPATVYALVEGSIWTGSAWDHSHHLLRSEDGGATFARVHSEPIATRPDLWIDRRAAGPLYLVAGNQLKQSTDHGLTFTPVGTLPISSTAAKLAGSEAGAPHFYCALIGDSGWSLYSSTNAGSSWVLRGELADFYGTLIAPVTDANQVLYGGVNCHRSTDGGASFNVVNEWWEYYGDPDTKLHADIFGFNSHFLPAPGAAGAAGDGEAGERSVETLLIHTDGGTYKLAPTATVPQNLTRFGFPNAQYYGTLTTLTDPNVIFAGSQDQGYQISHPGLGTVTPEFTQVISGDYAHLTSAWPDRSRMVYSVYPGFVLVQTGPGDFANLELASFPSGAPGFAFLPAITADPDDTARAYVGARKIWQLQRTAPSAYDWSPIPFDFDAGIGDIVGALAIAPSDHNRWYVATYAGFSYRSEDHGISWARSTIVGPPSHYFSGSDVIVSPTDAQLAYVGGSGYSNPGVFRTTDGGSTWAPLGDGLPPTQVYALAFGEPGQTLYAATQAGPFRFNPGTQAWVNLLTTTCCPPLTDYWDVESVPSSGVIRFSTYGRGIWDYDPDLTISVPETAGAPPLAVELGPNPARARSALEFTLPAAGQVEIGMYDVLGRRVLTLADGWRGAGQHRVAFDLRTERGLDLAAGLYLVRVVTPEATVVRRLTVLK
jgi:photosystem II stability/assembly factor-like uncharacterized protein